MHWVGIIMPYSHDISLNTTLGKDPAASTSTTTTTATDNSSQTDPALNPVIAEGGTGIATAENRLHAHRESEDVAQSEDLAESEDQAETDNEGEDELKTHECKPETHKSDQSEPEHHESKSWSRAHDNKPQNDRDEPAPKDRQIASEIDDPAASGSFLGMAKKTVGRAKRALTSKVKAVGSYIMDMGHGQMHLVYEKKTSIDLPHGKGPKTYCRWISYKPTNCKLSPDPVITLTIKPSRHCHHEDTHLFVRFAGYNYTPHPV